MSLKFPIVEKLKQYWIEENGSVIWFNPEDPNGKRLRQSDLANEMGESQETLTRARKGERPLTDGQLFELCHSLNLSEGQVKELEEALGESLKIDIQYRRNYRFWQEGLVESFDLLTKRPLKAFQLAKWIIDRIVEKYDEFDQITLELLVLEAQVRAVRLAVGLDILPVDDISVAAADLQWFSEKPDVVTRIDNDLLTSTWMTDLVSPFASGIIQTVREEYEEAIASFRDALEQQVTLSMKLRCFWSIVESYALLGDQEEFVAAEKEALDFVQSEIHSLSGDDLCSCYAELATVLIEATFFDANLINKANEYLKSARRHTKGVERDLSMVRLYFAEVLFHVVSSSNVDHIMDYVKELEDYISDQYVRHQRRLKQHLEAAKIDELVNYGSAMRPLAI